LGGLELFFCQKKEKYGADEGRANANPTVLEAESIENALRINARVNFNIRKGVIVKSFK